MKFPTYEEMAQNVAEKALDEYAYKGKTLRQWIEIIYNSEHGTNLASLGTDVPDINVGELISREQAKDALNAEIMKRILADDINDGMLDEFDTESIIRQLPTIQPKRGRWIEYEQEFMLEEPFKTVQKTVRECSVCTAKIAGMIGIMNYCPNCGAKMEVDDE